ARAAHASATSVTLRRRDGTGVRSAERGAMHVLDVERGVDLPFGPRGALSDAIIAVLAGEDGRSSAELPELAAAAVEGIDAIRDDDVQLSLFLLYALAYGSLDQVGAEWEWDPDLIRTRTVLETAFERALREQVPMPELPEAT